MEEVMKPLSAEIGACSLQRYFPWHPTSQRCQTLQVLTCLGTLQIPQFAYWCVEHHLNGSVQLADPTSTVGVTLPSNMEPTRRLPNAQTSGQVLSGNPVNWTFTMSDVANPHVAYCYHLPGSM